VDSVGGTFHITSKQQSGEDITDSYHDNEARLNSLRIQEERLLAMLESAEELQYLIEVQRELSDVQYQIDSYTSSKLRMENQVAMSTVYLYLSEVVEYDPVEPAPITFGQRLQQAAEEAFASFVDFLQGLILSIVWMSPFLIFLAMMIGIILLIVIPANRKKRRLARQLREEHLQKQQTQADEDSGEK
jgi:heme exporter protein D